MHILHQTIGTPQFKIKAESKNLAHLTVGPLPSGYGVTVGNSLRRVLLSGLPGTAITAVKIDGLNHEYSTIDGVMDSFLDITLNIRSLRLCKHSKDPVTLEVPLVKSGVVRAKDLSANGDVDVLEPSQVITTCDGANPKNKLHLRVEKGVGFRIVSNQDNAAETDTGFVLVDANFSPVTRVKYEIVPVRVGDLTNLDQLKMEVETDGSLEAEKAIKLAAGMLESYFQLFNLEDAYVDEEFTSTFSEVRRREQEAKKAAEKSNEDPSTPIDILGVSQRTLNALVNGGITSIEKLVETPMNKLSQLRGFGQKARTELDQVMKERGYSFVVSSAATAPINSEENN